MRKGNNVHKLVAFPFLNRDKSQIVTIVGRTLAYLLPLA